MSVYMYYFSMIAIKLHTTVHWVMYYINYEIHDIVH